MKIKILLLLLLTKFTLFCVDYNKYEMEKVYDYKVGHGKDGANNTLGIALPGSQGPSPTGPDISFFNNSLHIIDVHRSRTLKLNDQYNFEEEYGFAFFESIIYDINNVLISVNKSSSIRVIENEKTVSSIIFYQFENFKYCKSVYYQNNTLFIHDKNNKLWSILNPTTDWKDNRNKLTSEEDTIKLINSGAFEGLMIDSEKRLFLNEDLKTIDFDTFLSYHREIQKRKGLERPKVNFTMQVKDFKTGSENLIGTDDFGYTYWSSWNTDIAVFNPDGFLIELFVVNKEYIPTYPAITSEGDIYFMHHDVDKVTLYKIKRQW